MATRNNFVPFEVTDNAQKILEKRYLQPGEDVDGMFRRVSFGVQEFYELMRDGLFLPNSPTLFNAGANNGGTLSACFRFEIADTLLGDVEENGARKLDSQSIMGTTIKAAAVAKAGGGVGYYLGNIRAKGSPVKSVHRKSCGPVEVLRHLHSIRNLITQGGKRDLAQMGILPCHHPDIRDFIHAKDEDPKALESFNISVSWTDDWLKKVNFEDSEGQGEETDLWWEQCRSAWKTGDPGVYFFDAAERANPTPWLGQLTGTNPCLVGSTKVYVADGRGVVPIEKLAKTGKDVPVFCMGEEGVTIRMMRRPRRTGVKLPVYKVTLDNGQSVTATGNHKFRTRKQRGGVCQDVEVRNLRPGDSLRVVTRYVPEECRGESRSDRYVSLSWGDSEAVYEHTLVGEWKFGRPVSPGEHVHHLDGDRLNNAPDNLDVVDASSHLQGHSEGPCNANAKAATNEEIIEAGRKLCRYLGRRFSRKEWMETASRIGLPVKFSAWRAATLGSVSSFSKKCAILEGLGEYNDKDPRTVRKYHNAIESNLDAYIIGRKVVVVRECENCGGEYLRSYRSREVGYCSISCANSARSTSKMKASLRETVRRKQAVVRQAQVKVYKNFQEQFGRNPSKSEWVLSCRREGVSAEISRKSSPFRSYSELVESSGEYNHKVVSVEFDGYQDVYNGTVDEFHNFLVGGWDEGLTDKGRRKHVFLCNPQCGEVPLLPDEPCNLGSIALHRFVKLQDRTVDWPRLIETVRTAIRFLDTILDNNVFPHEDITRAAFLTRKLGLGVMGWADMLALMKVPYATVAAVDFAGHLMQVINNNALWESLAIASTKGRAPCFVEGTGQLAPRNATRTCIAPTGSIGIIADASSGIEPHYALKWDRTTNEGIKMEETISVGKYLNGFVPQTANEIPLEWHVKHQAAFQKHTNLAVSKTINVPNSATVKDISDAYKMMWELGCKGGTVFRDGCRSEQVLRAKDSKKSVYVSVTKDDAPPETKSYTAQKRAGGVTIAKRRDLPNTRTSVTHKFRVGGTKGYLTVGLFEDGTPAEIFLSVSRGGSTLDGILDTWAKTFSTALQWGTPLMSLIAQHEGTRFEPAGLTDNEEIRVASSIPDYVVRFLKSKFTISHKWQITVHDEKRLQEAAGSGHFCPDCGKETVLLSGCLYCVHPGCGWSKCG